MPQKFIKNWHCSKRVKIKMTTSKLSPSALKLSIECPRCFWLHHHKVWKRPSSPMATLPTGMDRILKEHFEKFMKQDKLPPEICENGECKSMKLFTDTDKLKIWQSNFKGVQYEDKDGNVLKGAVDNILTKGKKLIVLDYKTRGFPVKEDTIAGNQNQLDTYNYLLRKNGYETEDYGFLLFYMPKEVMATGEVIFDTQLEKVKTNPSNAEKIWKNGLKLLDGDCPTKCCDWCEGR